MELETNLERVKKLAEESEGQNVDFRSFLKFSDHSDVELDRMVRRHFEEVSAQIDCRSCGNCCREMLPVLSRGDIRRLAAKLNLTEQALIDCYLRPSEEKGHFEFKGKPCPFLSGNECTVYDARPGDCRSYPHLHKKKFRYRLWGVLDNCSVCPIVFNVVERLKDELWPKRDGDDFLDEENPVDWETMDQVMSDWTRRLLEEEQEGYGALPSMGASTGDDAGPRESHVGRYDPCPCGSGKKYKFCCGRKK